jgi:hypothetical protein
MIENLCVWVFVHESERRETDAWSARRVERQTRAVSSFRRETRAGSVLVA